MVETWPGARKAETWVFSRSSASRAGGMSLWEQRTEKFSGGESRRTAAVPGAVVSKPTAKKTTSLAGFSRATRTASAAESTTRTSAPSALASSRVSSVPGTRSMSPKVQTMAPSSRASFTARLISAVEVTQTGQPGPS